MFSIQSSLAIIVPAVASICTILLLRKKKKIDSGQEENLKDDTEDTDQLDVEHNISVPQSSYENFDILEKNSAINNEHLLNEYIIHENEIDSVNNDKNISNKDLYNKLDISEDNINHIDCFDKNILNIKDNDILKNASYMDSKNLLSNFNIIIPTSSSINDSIILPKIEDLNNQDNSYDDASNDLINDIKTSDIIIENNLKKEMYCDSLNCFVYKQNNENSIILDNDFTLLTISDESYSNVIKPNTQVKNLVEENFIDSLKDPIQSKTYINKYNSEAVEFVPNRNINNALPISNMSNSTIDLDEPKSDFLNNKNIEFSCTNFKDNRQAQLYNNNIVIENLKPGNITSVLKNESTNTSTQIIENSNEIHHHDSICSHYGNSDERNLEYYSPTKRFDDIVTSFIDDDDDDSTINKDMKCTHQSLKKQENVCAGLYFRNIQEEEICSSIYPNFYANVVPSEYCYQYYHPISVPTYVYNHGIDSGIYSMNQVPNWADEVENWMENEMHGDNVFTTEGEEEELIKNLDFSQTKLEPPIKDNNNVLEPDTEPIVDVTSDLSDSGQGSASSNCLASPNHLVIVYYFEFPTSLCGMLIGKHGQNINLMSKESGTDIIILTSEDETKEMQIVSLTGSVSSVHKALKLMRDKFPLEKYPEVNFDEITTIDDIEPTNLLQQVYLPEYDMCEALVTSVVNVNHVFIQIGGLQNTLMLESFHSDLSNCYNSLCINSQLELNRPIPVNTVCVTPMLDGWFRAIVLEHDISMDECLIRLLDYGGLMRIKANYLKRIRRDFLTIPFQAIECYLADCFPPTTSGFPEYSVPMMDRIVAGNLYHVVHTHQLINDVPVIKLLEAPDFEGGPYVSLLRRMAACGICLKLECIPQMTLM